jgi:hypothetical protein
LSGRGGARATGGTDRKDTAAAVRSGGGLRLALRWRRFNRESAPFTSHASRNPTNKPKAAVDYQAEDKEERESCSATIPFGIGEHEVVDYDAED